MTDLRRDGYEKVELKDLDPYDPRRIKAYALKLSKKDRQVITCDDLLGIDKQKDVKQKNNTESISCDQLDEKGLLKEK